MISKIKNFWTIPACHLLKFNVIALKNKKQKKPNYLAHFLIMSIKTPQNKIKQLPQMKKKVVGL